MRFDPLPVVDTRPLFRPLTGGLVRLLRTLDDQGWRRRAVGSWEVRDVVSHLTDTALRRVSVHRDGHAPPVPSAPLAGPRELAAFVNELNAGWVSAGRRLSTRVLTDLYALAAAELSDFIERLPLDAPPMYPVSWAGHDADAGWLDLGREFTEQWHHQMQIRDAVGAPRPGDAAWLRAVLAICMRALPFAYAGVEAPTGRTVLITVTGESGNRWALRRSAEGWRLWMAEGEVSADAAIELSEDAAWRLLFNAVPQGGIWAHARWRGPRELLEPLSSARAVIV